MSPRYKTHHDLAEVFGVTPKTVINWIESGKIRAIKMSFKLYFITIPEYERVLEHGLEPVGLEREAAEALSSHAAELFVKGRRRVG